MSLLYHRDAYYPVQPMISRRGNPLRENWSASPCFSSDASVSGPPTPGVSPGQPAECDRYCAPQQQMRAVNGLLHADVVIIRHRFARFDKLAEWVVSGAT